MKEEERDIQENYSVRGKRERMKKSGREKWMKRRI